MNDQLGLLEIRKIAKALLKVLRENKQELISLNKKITDDTEATIADDFQFVVSYLQKYTENYQSINTDHLKPKGNVLIILSYNEPFIMSLIPVLNCLAAGNRLTVRPSTSNTHFFELLWKEVSEASQSVGQQLTISSQDRDEMLGSIQTYNSVYFFGGYKTAKTIAIKCAEHLIEFYPHVEGADLAVLQPGTQPKINQSSLADSLLEQSFSHKGQSCQRIQGIYIHKDNLDSFVKELESCFKTYIQYNPSIVNFSEPQKKLTNQAKIDIKNSDSKRIIKSEFSDIPALVIEPSDSSNIVKESYFLPILWIKSYDTTNELFESINNRKYFLGLNIWSKSQDFIDEVINNTKHSRYTVNTKHTNIRTSEGWGGTQPTGFGGYKPWLETFSNSYTVIR